MGRNPVEGTTILAKRIQFLRKKNNMKQGDLAKELGITGSAVGSYERGTREPTIETLAWIATVFNTTTDYLIGLTDEEEKIVPQQINVKELRQFLMQDGITANGIPLDNRTKERLLDVVTGMSLMK